MAKYIWTAELPARTGPLTIAAVTAPATAVLRIYDTYVMSPVGVSDRLILAWQRVDTPDGAITWTGNMDEMEVNTQGNASGATIKYDNLTNDHTYLAGKVGYRDVDIVDGYRWEPPIQGGFYLGPGLIAGLKVLKAITSAVLVVEIHAELVGGA